jgi:H+/Cl- antiporter ClcA
METISLKYFLILIKLNFGDRPGLSGLVLQNLNSIISETMIVDKRIRIWLKNLFDRFGNERLRLNFLQALPFWVASLVTGLVAVFYARLFGYAEGVANYIFNHDAWALFILTPFCFIMARWLVKRFAPYARGSGIPQVMASIELATPKYNERVNELLNLRILIIKILSSLVLVLGGGVIGREGPTIQIAGSIFRKINLWLPAWWPKISKRNMIMAGAAAGLAAAFNTPLGGIVFTVEELTKTHISYFKTALFTAVIIAGLTAQGILGPYLYLGYPNVNNLSSFIFLGVVAVALVTGLLGALMSKIILKIFKWKSGFRFRYQYVLYVAVSGFIIAALAFFVSGKVLGSGKELMTITLFTSNKYSAWYIPLLRVGGTIISFTSGAAGGIFAPALSAGASVGSLAANWFHLSEGNSDLLILAGMVGLLTGITRTPFTAAILVLEMTDRHNLIFQLMLAAMTASLVANIIDSHSFYDHLKFQYLEELNKEGKKIHIVREDPLEDPED